MEKLPCAYTPCALFDKIATLKKAISKRYIRKFYVLYSIQLSVVDIIITQYIVVFIRNNTQNKFHQKISL